MRVEDHPQAQIVQFAEQELPGAPLSTSSATAWKQYITSDLLQQISQITLLTRLVINNRITTISTIAVSISLQPGLELFKHIPEFAILRTPTPINTIKGSSIALLESAYFLPLLIEFRELTSSPSSTFPLPHTGTHLQSFEHPEFLTPFSGPRSHVSPSEVSTMPSPQYPHF